MLDIKYIREHTDLIRDAISKKKIQLDLDQLLEIDQERRQLLSQIEQLNADRKKAAAERDVERGKQIKEQLGDLESKFRQTDSDYENLMVKVPTAPSPDTPLGQDECDNVEVHRWGDIPQFNFDPKDSSTLAHDLDLIDFDRGVKVAGYRGYYVKNELVMIQMGLMIYALQKLIQKGFTPMIPPTLIREFALFGSGYFAGREYDPKIDEIYKIANNEKLADGSVKKENKFLVGTAEPSLLAYYANEILEEKNLPMKICGFSPCYRSEIGSYGRDTKGLYRVHEFMKVEQIAIMSADIDLSDQIHQEFVAISRELHEDLGLPYRQIQICTGDLTTGKYKQYDLEAWLPSTVNDERQGWAETGSASNFLDWQSRRLNVKYKDQEGNKKYVYMLNNTAIPSPRFLMAILENYQQTDGSIVIPEVLRPYLGGMEKIEVKK